MTLTVTERCNLRCAYCYVPVARGRTMPEAVADAAVDLLARHAAPEGPVTLSFFGGEPFLATSLMRRAADRARPIGRDGRRLRLTTTTNGLLVGDAAVDFCRESGMEVAVSIDGDASPTDRPYATGRGSSADVLAKLPAILSLDPGAKLIARMTVTPDNVGDLARRVRALARLGFRRIFFLPAYEMHWSEEAVQTFGREHRRIGTWIVRCGHPGARVPDLPTWRGIEDRLRGGRPKGACGAGVSQVAVAPDGRLLACYRLLSEVDGPHVLGDVEHGFTNDEALRRFASLDPAGVRPEDGDCTSCSARDGCTYFCPSLGIAMKGEPRAVPASVCQLTRAAVDAVRASITDTRRRGGARTGWRVAAVAAVVSGATAACGGAIDGSGGICPSSDGGALARDAAGDAEDAPRLLYDAGGPGICPVQTDAEVDSGDGGDSSHGGGICPPPPPPGIC